MNLKECVVMLTLKIKRLTESTKLPTKAHKEDACWDLYADEDVMIHPCTVRTIKTGISTEIPDGYCAIIYGRSGLASKQCCFPIGGVIDSNYRGEWLVCLYNGTQEYTNGINSSGKIIKISNGDKIAQLKLEKIVDAAFLEANQLVSSERGENAFGSSDLA